MEIEQIQVGKRKGLRSVVTIGSRHYQFNPNKISKVLATALTKLTKTKQYKGTQEIKRVYQGVRLRKSLASYAIKYKPEVNDAVSAFNQYTNVYAVSNIKLKGLKGLSYLKYQYDKLQEYLSRNTGMKILVVASINFLTDEDDDGVPSVTREVRSRRYDIHNPNDLHDALNNMAGDIELIIETRQFHKSNLRVHSIDKLVIHYDRYNPTRGGSYLDLSDWIQRKKACINIKNDDDKCFKYSVQCGVHQVHAQKNPQEVRQYKKLNDNILNWDLMKYPAGDRDIDRFEETNKGIISVNVYEEYHQFENLQ